MNETARFVVGASSNRSKTATPVFHNVSSLFVQRLGTLSRQLRMPFAESLSSPFREQGIRLATALVKRLQCNYNICMPKLVFDWDDRKARANLSKHGISFEEAATVFYDENALEFYDDEHSDWEDRFLLLGVSSHLRILMVCHCHREESSVIRIISARKATKRERSFYPGGIS